MLFWIKIIVICVTFWAPLAAWSNTEEENGDLLSTAFNAISNEDWVTVDHFAAQISDSVGSELVLWERLRQGEGNWSEYMAFLNENSDWPGLKRLRRKGEAAIPPNANAANVRKFFQIQKPQTGTGSIRLAEAYSVQGRKSEARTEAIRAWLQMSLKEHEEYALYAKYKGALSLYNVKRLENLFSNNWLKPPAFSWSALALFT